MPRWWRNKRDFAEAFRKSRPKEDQDHEPDNFQARSIAQTGCRFRYLFVSIAEFHHGAQGKNARRTESGARRRKRKTRSAGQSSVCLGWRSGPYESRLSGGRKL